MRTLRLRRQRGQAAVELALLSILIIPTFLYILFLDDLLRFKQDQQETMVAVTWDFTTLNYDHQTKKTAQYLPNQPAPADESGAPAPPGPKGEAYTATHEGNVTYFGRLQYADHTASTPRFEDPLGLQPNAEKHHLAVSAHQCWLVGGRGNQVWCEQRDGALGTNYTIDGTVNGRSNVHSFVSRNGSTGGLYECRGRVGVLNHMLPTGNMWFTKEDLTKRTYHGATSGSGNIGFDGKGVHSYRQSKEAYHFPTESFSIVTHPWAMTDQEDFEGGQRGFALYDRVNQVYTSVGPIGMIGLAYVQYPLRALQQQLINPLILLDAGPIGDMLATPEVAFSKNLPSPQVNGFYSSQSKDWGGDDVIKHHNNRGTWYLGAKSRP